MILSIINLKGGVGKTVTTVHLGASLASLGYRTLLVDTDLQHGLTSYFDLDVRGQSTTAHVLLDGSSAREAAREVRAGLWVLPATAHMEIVDRELPHLSGADLRLRRALRGLDNPSPKTRAPQPARAQAESQVQVLGSEQSSGGGINGDEPFDFVLIDCPSGWGAIARNPSLAASRLLMPINCEPAALKSAHETQSKASELCEFYAHDLAPSGVLLTCWRSTKIAASVAESARRSWPQLFETRIRRTEKINELAAFRETLFDAGAPAASASVREDYKCLAEEVLRLGSAR